MKLTDSNWKLQAEVFLFVLLFCCTQLFAQEEPAAGGADRAQTARLVKALDSRFHSTRGEARTLLGAMGAAAVKQLVEALENDLPGVRSNAALVLGRMKVKEAVPELLRLVEDPSLEVRKGAVEALGQVGTDAVDILRHELENARGRRKEVIEGLLGRALEDAVTGYIEKMMISPDKCLYCPGPVEELKKLGPGVLKALEQLSDWNRYGYMSYYALNTIGDLGDKKAVDFLKKKYDEARLTGTVVYRAGAAMSLSKLGEPSYAQKVITDIKTDVYTNTEVGKHSSSGATYLEIGKLDEAEKEFREAKKLMPDELSYTFRLGCVYGLRGDAKKTVEYLKGPVEEGFVKASFLQRVAYFNKVRDSDEWKEFIKEALEKEEKETRKENKEEEEKKSE
jgi:tetratricopeptide (TPR) repeat protein